MSRTAAKCLLVVALSSCVVLSGPGTAAGSDATHWRHTEGDGDDQGHAPNGDAVLTTTHETGSENGSGNEADAGGAANDDDQDDGGIVDDVEHWWEDVKDTFEGAGQDDDGEGEDDEGEVDGNDDSGDDRDNANGQATADTDDPDPTGTPAPTQTPDPAPTPTPSPTATQTPTPTPTATLTPTPTPTRTQTPTSTPSSTPTPESTPTPTPEPTSTPTQADGVTSESAEKTGATSTGARTSTGDPSTTPTGAPTDPPTGTERATSTDADETDATVVAENETLDVVDATMPADWVQNGTNATVRATVANREDRTVTGDVPVTVGGERVAVRTLSLGPGERTTVRFQFEATTAGRVVVGDVAADRLRVGTEPSGGAGVDPAPVGFADGFQVFLGVLAVLSVGLAAYFRSRS